MSLHNPRAANCICIQFGASTYFKPITQFGAFPYDIYLSRDRQAKFVCQTPKSLTELTTINYWIFFFFLLLLLILGQSGLPTSQGYKVQLSTSSSELTMPLKQQAQLKEIYSAVVPTEYFVNCMRAQSVCLSVCVSTSILGTYIHNGCRRRFCLLITTGKEEAVSF